MSAAQQKKFLADVQDSWKKLAISLLQFYDAATAEKKPSRKQKTDWELNSFTNLVVKLHVDAFKLKKIKMKWSWKPTKNWEHPVPTQNLLILIKTGSEYMHITSDDSNDNNRHVLSLSRQQTNVTTL